MKIEEVMSSILVATDPDIELRLDILKAHCQDERFMPWLSFKLAAFEIGRNNFTLANSYLENIESLRSTYLQYYSYKYVCIRELGQDCSDLMTLFFEVRTFYAEKKFTEKWAQDLLLLSNVCNFSDDKFGLYSFLIKNQYSISDMSIVIAFRDILEKIHHFISTGTLISKYRIVCDGSFDLVRLNNDCLIINLNVPFFNKVTLNNEGIIDSLLNLLLIFLNKYEFDSELNWEASSVVKSSFKLLNSLLAQKIRQKIEIILRKNNNSNLKFSYCNTPRKKYDDKLIVRAGNGELWAVRNYFVNPSVFFNGAMDATSRSNQAIEKKESFAAIDKWPELSVENSWSRLITAGGWYARPGFEAEAIFSFVDLYTSGLTSGRLVDVYLQDIYINYQSGLPVNPSNFISWSDQIFTDELECRKELLIISPFASSISRRWNSGELNQFWNALGFKAGINQLHAIESTVTIWPYQPHNSWLDTFNRYTLEIDSLFEKNNIEVFFASCGSYSIPLAYYVNKKYGIRSITFGHHIHIYFGIFSNAFALDPKVRYLGKNSPLWDFSDLNDRYPAIGAVDGGRYIS